MGDAARASSSRSYDAATRPCSPARPAGSASRCARGCRALGWTVRGFDRAAARRRQSATSRSPADLDAACAGVDAIVHLAGQPTEAPWPVHPRGEHRGHVPGVRGRPPRRRAPGRLRVVQPRRRVHAGRRPSCRPTSRRARTPSTASARSSARRSARYYVDRYGMQVACLRIGTFADRPRRPALAVDLALAGRLRPARRRLPALRRRSATRWCGAISANTRRTWSLDAGAGARLRAARRRRDLRRRPRRRRAAPVRRVRRRRLHLARFGIDEVAARCMIDAATRRRCAPGSPTTSTRRRRRRAAGACSTPATTPSSPTGSRPADVRHRRAARAAARRAERHEPRRRAPRRRRPGRLAARARARRAAGRRRLRRAARLARLRPRLGRDLRRGRLRRRGCCRGCCRRRCSRSPCSTSTRRPA